MDEIDYKVLFEDLQHENETLRERIAKIKLSRSWLQHISYYDVLKLVTNPYFILGYFAGAIVCFLLFYTKE